MIKKAVACLFRLGSLTIILALPIGYYGGSDDSTHLAIGIHGGKGHFVGVYETGCESPPIVTINKFKEIQGSIYIRPTLSESVPLIFGLRAGQFSARMEKPDTDYVHTCHFDYKFYYCTPNLSFENDIIGFGAGYNFGHLAWDYVHNRRIMSVFQVICV